MIINNKKLLSIILGFQVGFCLILLLDILININLLLIRFIIGFIFLVFIPGFLVLRILGLNRLNLEAFLYSIGLSISTLMFIGFLLNVILPVFGMKKPLTLIPLSVAVNIFVITLIILAFIKNRSDLEFSVELPKEKFAKLLLIFLFILPTLTAIGVYEFLYHDNNKFLLLLLATVAVVTILAALYNRKELTIWFISIALLFYGSLGSKYVVVIGDPHVEYYFANLTLITGFWNIHLKGTHNAMLEVAVLQPLYSILLGIDLTLTFKIVYPLIFSFCPLVLYLICKHQFDDRIAFLSVLIFMFSPMFYNAYANSTRWGTALFFMFLIVLSVIENKSSFLQSSNLLDIQKFLAIIFALSLIVSHYTSSYVFMFLLIFVSVIYIFLKIIHKIELKIKLSPNFTLFYIVSSIGYYMYVASSSAYNLMYSYFRHVDKTIRENIFSPNVTYVGFIAKKTWPFSVEAFVYFTYLFIILGMVGLFVTLYELLFKSRYNKKYKKFSITIFYLLGAIYYYMVLAISTLGMYGPPRAFFMSLLFTAPFIVRGWFFIFRITKIILKNRVENITHIILLLILILYFLISSGFVCETITKNRDYSPTVFISKNRCDEIKDPYFIVALYRRYIPDVDVWSAYWLSKFRALKKKIYVDGGTGGKGHVGWVTLHSYGMIRYEGNISLLHPNVKIKKGSYVYLRSYNVKNHVFFYGPPTTAYNLTILGIKNMSKIYTNGGSEIYYKY